ncbi:MAG: SDR family oxidoreductase [bacterium]
MQTIKEGGTYVVMGLLDRLSIAYSIGTAIQSAGGRVVFTFQGEVLKKRYWDSDKTLGAADKVIEHRFCDVTVEDDVKRLFSDIGPVSGVVHSIAYANPKTCLGTEFHTDAIDDIKKSYHISAVSFATVARYAAPCMKGGGSLVALTFDTSHTYPLYNWMGVHKAALEAIVRALARRHGRELIRVNAVSSGPLATTAASKIPDFMRIGEIWQASSPIPWDPLTDAKSVADAVVFLLGQGAAKITGQVLAVDGGAAMVGGSLMDHERPVGPAL